MKNFPWILAAVWLVARVAVGRYMGIEAAKNFGVLSNVLLVLILIFVTIYGKYRITPKEKPPFFEDIKACMMSAMKYVLGVSLAIGLYYGFMSNDIDIIREERLTRFEKEISTEEGLQRFYEEVPQEKGTSREELIEKNQKNVNTFVSIKTQVVGGFITLTLVSFIYTLLATVIWRVMMRKA